MTEHMAIEPAASRFRIKLYLLFFLPVVVLLILVSAYSLSAKELDDTTRTHLPGEFVRLSQGYTHYELTGDPSGQVVVLIHGGTVPYIVWDRNVDALTQSGLRVLRYDQYGKGYSDRPDAIYDGEFLTSQLSELLEALEIDGPVSLIGLSQGGKVAVTYAAAYPERVAKIVLIDPAGPYLYGDRRRDIAARMLSNAVEYLLHREARNWAQEEFLGDDTRLLLRRARRQFEYAGVFRAIASAVRNSESEEVQIAYEKVGRSDTPVLLIWGEDDPALPIELHEEIQRYIPDLEFRKVPGAGHIPHFEQPGVVNPLIVEFLGR